MKSRVLSPTNKIEINNNKLSPTHRQLIVLSCLILKHMKNAKQQ